MEAIGFLYKSNALNTVLTTAEGIGLGVLGIGLPDIMIWTTVLLRGIYASAFVTEMLAAKFIQGMCV